MPGASTPLDTQRGLHQGHELSLERVLQLEAGHQTLAARTPDFVEGVQRLPREAGAALRVGVVGLGVGRAELPSRHVAHLAHVGQ